jgi:hypothetical protein
MFNIRGMSISEKLLMGVYRFDHGLPENIRFPGFLGIIPSLICQQAGQQKGHFRIVFG